MKLSPFLREVIKKCLSEIITYQIIVLTSLSLSSIISELHWAVEAGTSIGACLYYYMKNYFSFHCLGLVFFSFIFKSTWKKLFSWKVFVWPALVLVIYSFSQWRLNSLLNYNCYILGYRWSWVAIITWSLLFITQLILYQQKQIDNVLSFVLSIYGVLLAQLVYEIPYYWQCGQLIFLGETLIGLIFIALLLYIGWRPTHHLIIAVVPIILGWATLFNLSYHGLAWVPRLTTIPFFLMFPLTFSTHKNAEVEQ